MSLPVFYLKINTNTDFAVECFNHWTNIVEALGADYYIVCDREDLKERVINDKNKDKYMPTLPQAKQLLRSIVDASWLNAGAALLTPFIHAKENGYDTFWNIDADDTVICADAFKIADTMKKVQEYADNTYLDCFSLDMHSSPMERLYPHWTFGVCYCKLHTDYISKLIGFNDFFKSENLTPNDLFGTNLDEVFSILGKYSKINTGTFYFENLYFRHNDFEIHCYKNQRFVFRNLSQFTKLCWRTNSDEDKNGLPIPERFVKFDVGLKQTESLDFLENNAVFNNFIGRKCSGFESDYLAEKVADKRKKIVLFGAGRDGLRTLVAFRTLFETEPYYFCDNSSKVAGTEIHGVDVINFEQLKALSTVEEICVLITTSAYYSEIRTQLSSVNVEILN
jgi:Predicted nucleoside-diphosphate sugar epimerases